MKTTIENLEFPCEIKKKLKMKQLTSDEIIKNRVETINQYRVLQYLKKNLNIFSFKISLYDKDTIKVIDCEEKQVYFRYDEIKKEILFREKEIEQDMFSL